LVNISSRNKVNIKGLLGYGAIMLLLLYKDIR
jgi:hypothetical protein